MHSVNFYWAFAEIRDTHNMLCTAGATPPPKNLLRLGGWLARHLIDYPVFWSGSQHLAQLLQDSYISSFCLREKWRRRCRSFMMSSLHIPGLLLKYEAGFLMFKQHSTIYFKKHLQILSRYRAKWNISLDYCPFLLGGIMKNTGERSRRIMVTPLVHLPHYSHLSKL